MPRDDPRRSDPGLVVPAGATCTLVSVRVNGSIQVRSGATLTASGTQVTGSVAASGHRLVQMSGSQVNGSLTLKQGKATTLRGNQIRMSLISTDNRGAQSFTLNQVTRSLSCARNVPAPTGWGNPAGTKLGQCRSL